MPIDTADMDAQGMADDASSTIRMCKTMHVEIKGTLSGFAQMGPEAATWKAVEGKQVSIFGVDDSPMMSSEASAGNMMLNAELSAATHSLKNATITKATLLQSSNNFPVPLGVSINVLPHNEMCDTGERYTFTTLSGMQSSHPSVLYEARDEQNQAAEWRKCYAKYNASNLETQDVLPVPNNACVFVHESHPVINLLRMNKHLLGVDIDASPKIDNQYYKITNSLMQTSCDTLRSKVLSKISTQDLTQFQVGVPVTDKTAGLTYHGKNYVQLHRIGGTEWDKVDSTDTMMTFQADPSWSEEQLASNLRAHEYNFTDRPCSFSARIQLEYELQK